MRPLLLLALAAVADAAPPTAPAVAAMNYQVTVDARDCAWPMCGGYFLRALNRATTPCADGTRSRWCYVAELDWTAAGWDPVDVDDFLVNASGGYVVLFGEQELRPIPPATDPYGVLVPRLAFTEFQPRPPAVTVPAPAVPPTAYDVRPDLRLCPSVACGGWWIRAVNRTQTTCADGTKAASCYVAEIDWTAAGWDPKDAAAFQAGAWGGFVLLYGPQELRSYGAADYGVLIPRLGLTEWAH